MEILSFSFQENVRAPYRIVMGVMSGTRKIVAALVGEDVGFRRDGGMFPNYFRVPVDAL
jgi:hypothetical protein